MVKERNSSIELLRIISMLFIVISHFTVHCGIFKGDLPLGFNRYLFEITTLGNIGVIIFTIISGYFLINKTSVKLKHITKITTQVFTYSVLFLFVSIVFFKNIPAVGDFIELFFPTIFNKYWFATAYIIIYIFSPYINKFLNSLSRKDYLQFLICYIFVVSIIPTFTSATLNLSNLIYLVLFYSIGAYLKKYPDNLFSKKSFSIKALAVSIVCLLVSPIIIDLLSLKFSFLSVYSIHIFRTFSIIAILFSVSLFSLFEKAKPFSNKFINTVSASTFGIYLIHDNYFIRDLLWKQLLPIKEFSSSPYLIVLLVSSVLAVFIISSVIDIIRNYIFTFINEKFFDKKIDSLQLKWDNFSDKFCDRIIKKTECN